MEATAAHPQKSMKDLFLLIPALNKRCPPVCRRLQTANRLLPLADAGPSLPSFPAEGEKLTGWFLGSSSGSPQRLPAKNKNPKNLPEAVRGDLWSGGLKPGLLKPPERSHRQPRSADASAAAADDDRRLWARLLLPGARRRQTCSLRQPPSASACST